MQITSITFPTLVYTPISDKEHKLAEPRMITVNMPAGKGYRFLLDKNFVTNLRSGTDLINPIIPKHGNEMRTYAYIVHDALYTVHYFSREFTDNLLKAWLTYADEETRLEIKNEEALPEPDKKYIKLLKSQILGSAKIWAIWKTVSWFGKSAFNEKIKPPYDGNEKRFFMEVI